MSVSRPKKRTSTDFVERINWVLKWLAKPTDFKTFCKNHQDITSPYTFSRWVYTYAPILNKIGVVNVGKKHQAHLPPPALKLYKADRPIWFDHPPEFGNWDKVFEVADMYVFQEGEPIAYQALVDRFDINVDLVGAYVHQRRLFNAYKTGEVKSEKKNGCVRLVLADKKMKPRHVGFNAVEEVRDEIDDLLDSILPPETEPKKSIQQNQQNQQKPKFTLGTIVSYKDSNDPLAEASKKVRSMRTAPYVPPKKEKVVKPVSLSDLIDMKKSLSKTPAQLKEDEFFKSLRGEESTDVKMPSVDTDIDDILDIKDGLIAELKQTIQVLESEKNELKKQVGTLMDQLGPVQSELKNLKDVVDVLEEKVHKAAVVVDENHKLKRDNERMATQIKSVREEFHRLLHHTVSAHAILLNDMH